MSDIKDLNQTVLANKFFVGSVVNNNDPKELKRVQIRIPVLFDGTSDSDLPWAIPSDTVLFGAGSNFNTVGVPEKGTDLLVIFHNGDASSPIYMGKITNAENLLKIAGTSYKDTYGFQDRNGNTFYVDQSDNTIKLKHASGATITLKNNKIELDTSSDITINAGGNVVVEAGGNATVEASGNVTVEAGGNVTVKAGGVATIQAPLINLLN